MDLQTICDEVSYLANDTTLGSSGVNYARTKAWVREVYYLDILSLRSDWWFLKGTATLNTEAGTNQYALPNGIDIKKIREISYNGGALDGKSEHDALNSGLDLNSLGEPKVFWHVFRSSGSDWIQLFPTPDAIYELNISHIPTADQLTDDSDVPSLPAEYQYLLVKGAYIKALKHNQDPNLELEMQEYQAALKRLVRDNARDDYKTDSWWK
jgi:hypothetical protein